MVTNCIKLIENKCIYRSISCIHPLVPEGCGGALARHIHARNFSHLRPRISLARRLPTGDAVRKMGRAAQGAFSSSPPPLPPPSSSSSPPSSWPASGGGARVSGVAATLVQLPAVDAPEAHEPDPMSVPICNLSATVAVRAAVSGSSSPTGPNGSS